MPNCKQCSSSFEVTDKDRKFLDQVSPVFGGKKYAIPEPTLCPDCRVQRRLAWRNERSMYHCKCGLTGKQIISMYSPDSPFPVYSSSAWFGDDWDAKTYGRDFDFSRSFFEQFAELQNKVPRLSFISSNNENCDFCNIVGDSKNCYLIYGSICCEDCYYGSPYFSKNCIDSLTIRKCELCYECIDSDHLYECFFCQNCANCQNLFLCYDLENCHDCFMCAGLNRKSYCILNQQYSEDEYKKKMEEAQRGDARVLSALREKFEVLKMKVVHLHMVGMNNEHVFGDHVYESKDSSDIFYSGKCEAVNRSMQIFSGHHCLDCDYGEFGEYLYEFSGHYKVSNCLFSHLCWDYCDSLLYSSACTLNVKDCFGCIGLKHSQYCILNKQYSKEEYEKLVSKIIEHMNNTGEWGEYFPISISPFAYNETVAQEYFPMNKEDVEKNRWKWKNEEEKISNISKIIPANRLPDSISDIPDDILDWAIECRVTKKLFKIIPQELEFYRKYNLPVPHECPNVRHLNRIALRNPRKLFDRKCDKCQKAIKTTYSSDRSEKVYCEACYLKEVY